MDELTVYARVGDAFGWGVTLLAAILIAPRTLAVAAGEAGTPAFARLLTDSLLPLAALAAAASWRPHLSPAIAWLPLPPMAVLAVAALLGSRRRPAEIGLRGGGFVPALALGLIFVGGLVLMTRQAWASHGLVPDLLPQGGQRWQAIAVQVLAVGLPFELWLRGLVFADAAAWRGWKAAVVWSGLLGAMAESARGGEAMVWALCAGAALGVLRARWAQVPALAIVHGVGDLALGFLFPPW